MVASWRNFPNLTNDSPWTFVLDTNRVPTWIISDIPKTNDDTDDEELDLFYDSELHYFYDPQTCKYYELITPGVEHWYTCRPFCIIKIFTRHKL